MRAHWLSWRCSLSPGEARERVRVARRLRELPLIRQAFGAGELSYCKVRALTRVASAELEADLVELARHATGAQLEKLVRGVACALSATVANAERAHESRYLTWSWEDDGSLALRARLPAEDGALLLAALEAAEDETPESVAERRADALVALARAEAKPCESSCTSMPRAWPAARWSNGPSWSRDRRLPRRRSVGLVVTAGW